MEPHPWIFIGTMALGLLPGVAAGALMERNRIIQLFRTKPFQFREWLRRELVCRGDIEE
jgi:hypothetical protein